MRLLAAVAVFVSLAACHRGNRLPVYGSVPEFELTAQDGRAFSSKVLSGQVWVADFMFTTCPGPCPRMTSQMHRVQVETIGYNDVKLVSFTVDPEHDTPTVLAAYAKQHAASPQRWYFLTGPPATLHHLDRDIFVLGNVDGSLLHSTRFIIMDRKARIRGYYDTSEPATIPRLIADIGALLEERS